jgi:penicillin G amidase
MKLTLSSITLVLALAFCGPSQLRGQVPHSQDTTTVTRDEQGIAHISASDEYDLFFTNGWIHAQDRLFQMDVSRRTASGNLAELLGPSSLSGDILFRQLGLRRAAERSLAALSSRSQAALQAYADGVNAYVQSNPLPSEYAALHLTTFTPWTALDSMTVSKFVAFSQSFDFLDVQLTLNLFQYSLTGAIAGFDGSKLLNDLFRPEPFNHATTIPDASQPIYTVDNFSGTAAASTSLSATNVPPQAIPVLRQILETVKNTPALARLADKNRRGGSNEWAIAGVHTDNGMPIVANDPHLPLGTPSTFYPIQLRAPGFNVVGASFAGAPGVVTGHNDFVSWGATYNPLDVTDYYFEIILPDPKSSSGFSTLYKGSLEPMVRIPETFRVNQVSDTTNDNIVSVSPGNGVPAATYVAPRRNQGPVLFSGTAPNIGVSVQYTGFSATREPDAIFAMDAATNLAEFQNALQWFDVGTFNLAYADVEGNIAYFTVGELPIREDLQAGKINGLPPFFIRNGTGGNEWLPVIHPQAGQAVPNEILPPEEMPHVVNPAAGFFVNANNDPLGLTLDNNPLNTMRPNGGILYLYPGYDLGLRAGRITELIENAIASGDKLSISAVEKIQADTKLVDSDFFVPFLTQALANARKSGANPLLAIFGNMPAVQAAVGRLAAWDGSSPVGIQDGYDPALDGPAPPFAPPSQQEILNSSAATIYSVWRGQLIRNTIDVPLNALGLTLPPDQQTMTALKHLFEVFPTQQGIGTSGLNFFSVPFVSNANDRRDILLLFSMYSALQRLSGAPFAPAFNFSTNLDDYRWGKLHRIVFAHPLGGDFNVPPAGIASPLPGLPGLPTDGGFGTVDVGDHDIRADAWDKFMFDAGAANRYVAQANDAETFDTVTSLPGGVSGVLDSPFHTNLLPSWLVNQVFSLTFETN